MARKYREDTNSPTKKRLYLTALLLIIFVLGVSLVRGLRNSLFFSYKDRINIVMYGQNPVYYSMGLRESGDFAVSFYPDLKVEVPGGYGFYKVGALGKLVSWDKKPEIFKRTFSLATSSLTDLYFYPEKSEVYFGDKGLSQAPIPKLNEILFMKSNANTFDRLYIAMIFANKKRSSIKTIAAASTKESGGDTFFLSKSFEEKYQGLLYQKTYRKEKKTVQLLYTKSYTIAQRIGKILEGNGIRVGDINSLNDEKSSQCLIKENTEDFSYTARSLAEFFGCNLKKDKTDIYDILFELGDKESEWEVSVGG